MAFLLPCPTCARHVRRTESVCPFCRSAVAFGEAPLPRLPEVRLGRAATFAFGAAIATSVAACSTGSPVPAYGAPAPDTGSVDAASGTDGGSAVDAAMAVDAAADVDTGSMAAAYGISPIDAGMDVGGSSSDYGAPPPP
jgi:hypothetical protein